MENVNPKQRASVPPALIGLIVAAMLVRIVIALVLPRVIKWDEGDYLLLGYNLLTGNGFTTGYYPELHLTPLYPLVSGLFFLFVGEFEQASNLAHALFGGLLLLPVFVIAQRIYGLQTAWLVALLLTIFPPLSISVLYWGAMIEPLYLCLIYGGLAALLVGFEDQRAGMFAVAGGLWGLAYLTRSEAIAYFGVFLLFGLVWLWSRVALPGFLKRYALGGFILCFLLLAAPYIWYLHWHTGQWMVTGKVNLVVDSLDAMLAHDGAAFDRINYGLDPSGKEINYWSPDRFKRSLLREVVLGDPARFFRRMYLDFDVLKGRMFGKTVFWYMLLPLVVLALLKEPWNRKRLMHEAFLITIIIVLLLVVLPFGYLVRYFAPAFPVLLLWTAQGAIGLGAWVVDTVGLLRGSPVSGKYLKTLLGWMPATMVVLFLLAMVPVAVQEHLHGLSLGEKKVGLWLREHSTADAKIMSRNTAVSLYANRRYVASPNTDWTRFLQYAGSHGADYLVTSSDELTRVRPHLSFLLETGAPELELVYSFEESQGRTLVYRISQSSTEASPKTEQTLPGNSEHEEVKPQTHRGIPL